MGGVKRKRRILYITYDGLTDALGQSQILSYLSELSCLDNEFYILSFEKQDNYQRNVKTVEKKVLESNIHWIRKWYTKKPPVLSTLMDIRTAKKEVIKLHQKYQFDIVHCRGYVPALIGQWLKRKFEVKFIFDMRGWWPDEKLESGSWARPLFRPVYNYFKVKERSFFQNADFNVSLTVVGQSEIVQKFHIPKEHTGVVPTCVNFDIFREYSAAVRCRIRKELGIKEEATVLVYSGALGGNYDLNLLQAIFKKFLAAYKEGFILILSKDPLTSQFEEELKQSGISNYLVTNVPYTEVSDFLCAADMGVIFYKPAFSNIGRSPTKLGEYWASGIPVLATEGIGDLGLLQQQYPGGIILADQNLSDLEQKLKQVKFENKQVLRSYAKDYCSLSKGVKFYESVYRQLSNSLKTD